MSSTSYRQLTLNGLWKNNPALVQLLGTVPFACSHGLYRQCAGTGSGDALCAWWSPTPPCRSFAPWYQTPSGSLYL